jgi:hypothetical protein
MSGIGSPKVIGISLKDRAAILPAGRMADGAYWFDPAAGNFVSSTYYFPSLPAWVTQFNAARPADKYLNQEWTSSGSDGQNGGGHAFIKMGPNAGPAFYNSLERTPYGNELIEAFAEAAIVNERIGHHEGTDILTVSFSANDYVGHALGPDAPEVRDISIRTDRILDKLFGFVDREVGMDQVLVVLTADHGVSPLPEVMKQRKMPGGRMSEAAVLSQVQAALIAKFGEGQWIVGKSGPAPYLNYDLIKQKGLNLIDVENAAAAAVREMPNIFRVYTRHQLMTGSVLDDMVDHRVRRGFHYQRAADLFIVPQPYWLFEERGTSHGTPMCRLSS